MIHRKMLKKIQMAEAITKLSRSFQVSLTDEAKERAKKDRTLEMSFSSEHPVRRHDYREESDFDEVLSHAPEDVDLSLLQNRGPLCDMHDLGRQIGVVESAEIGDSVGDGYKGKVGRAFVRFSKNPEAEKVYNDVVDGIRTHVSVGYEITGLISKLAGANGTEVRKFRWRPYEISSVSAPEDPHVGFGRGKENDLIEPKIKSVMEPNTAPTAPVVNVTEIENKARDAERGRITRIREATEVIIKNSPSAEAAFRAICVEAIANGEAFESFSFRALKALPGVTEAKPVTAASLGMTERDIKQFSLCRALSDAVTNRERGAGNLPNGLELEVHRAMEPVMQKSGISPGGFVIPGDLMVPVPMRRGRDYGRRDLNVTTFGAGGAFVPTNLLTPIIEILRNQMCMLRMGVQSMGGLSGNVVVPRQTGAATAYTLPETAALTESTQAIDQISLVPHRVGVTNKFSRLLLLQSSVDAENFVRNDELAVLGIKWDSLMMIGQGANSEPTGILNQPGIATVTFGGTATWAKVISFQTALNLGNALRGMCGFITSPSVMGAWQNIPKAGTTNQFPIFIWEPLNDDEYNDGRVNGYRAAATNQVPANLVFFGHWADSIQGLWGGIEFIVDPYTLAKNAQVAITCNTFGDFAVRHAASFAVSTDSGAQ